MAATRDDLIEPQVWTDESDAEDLGDTYNLPMSSVPDWLPPWLSHEQPLPDEPETSSSRAQQKTALECLPFLLSGHDTASPPVEVSEYGLRRLDRATHIRYLRNALGTYPGRYAGYDASRPWLVYWSLTGLALLGEDLSQFRRSVVATFTPLQNVTGGFGGGHGQMSHLATTYATVLSLVMVGGEEALELVNRETMWRWLASLKQRDGSFSICIGGEVDVRAAYCVTVVISLLNLPTTLPPNEDADLTSQSTFMDGLPEWLARCQTFEGGLGSAPDAEAHGAYVFCAIACFCILGEPRRMMNKHLDMPRLVAWLVSRQHAPEGGLAGRTNKLVDGCYSHWQGGCWSLVEAAMMGQSPSETIQGSRELDPVGLFNREGLIRYILCCCQADRGGLRDKPSMSSDAYHTCYNLVGLSSAQNHYFFQSSGTNDSAPPLTAAFSWASRKVSLTPKVSSGRGRELIDEIDRVGLIHPVYIIPEGTAERTRKYFEAKPSF